MAVKDQAALDEMMKGRIRLILDQPFFGTLCMLLDFVEQPDPNSPYTTMYTDGRVMGYHPPFVHSLDPDEVKGVQAHEVMHCVFKHFVRVGHRDPVWWNIAGDFVINLDLIKAGFKLPGEPVTMKSKPGTKGHLYDPDYEGMSTEEVYEKITQDLPKLKKWVAGFGDKSDIGGCGSVIAPQGSGKDDKDKNNPQDGSGSSASREAQEALAKDWDTNIRMAVSQAKARNAGNLPGCLARLVEEMNKPYVNWREQLKDFFSNCFNKDYSWSRPNRRTLSTGLILPGLISDGMHELICVFDCSGSIGIEQQKQYGGEAASALDDGLCDVMTVIYTDTDVQRVEQFIRGEKFEVSGFTGGGTHFDAVMDYIADNHPDAGAIIFLTDMMTGSFGKDPGIPVLWGATINESALKDIEVPFGRVIHVSD